MMIMSFITIMGDCGLMGFLSIGQNKILIGSYRLMNMLLMAIGRENTMKIK